MRNRDRRVRIVFHHGWRRRRRIVLLLNVAAMDQPEWNGSDVCGECVAIDGPKGSVTVRIVDLCPECEMGHLDLSQQALPRSQTSPRARSPSPGRSCRAT
jgi:hypothetical protein